LSSAAKEVEQERGEGLAVERDAREMHQTVLSVHKAEKEVSGGGDDGGKRRDGY